MSYWFDNGRLMKGDRLVCADEFWWSENKKFCPNCGSPQGGSMVAIFEEVTPSGVKLKHKKCLACGNVYQTLKVGYQQKPKQADWDSPPRRNDDPW